MWVFAFCLTSDALQELQFDFGREKIIYQLLLVLLPLHKTSGFLIFGWTDVIFQSHYIHT